MTAKNLENARHVVGIDVGASSVRVHILNYDDNGRPIGVPSAVMLPGSDPDGSLLTVIEIDATGKLHSAGRPAQTKVARGGNTRFVTEFKTSIAQNAADVAALGRPVNGIFCQNPTCTDPGSEWPRGQKYCGFCGKELQEATVGLAYKTYFRYSQQEALGYSGQLLSYIARQLETQYEALTAGTGWAVVCGVPVYWQAETLAAFEETLCAAFPRAALRLDVEPMSALRYYCLDGSLLELQGDETRSAQVLIIDSGASTTSLVLARVEEATGQPRLRVTSTYAERFGGSDFDTALAKHAASEVGVNLDATMLPYWKLLAREWKVAINAIPVQPGHTSIESAAMRFPAGGAIQSAEYKSVALNREAFGVLTADLAKRFNGILNRGIDSFNINPQTIRHVLFVGGGAHYSIIQPAVSGLLKNAQIIDGKEPEKSVSRGLAIAAARTGLRGTGRLSVATLDAILPKSTSEPETEQPVTTIKRYLIPPEDAALDGDGTEHAPQSDNPDRPAVVFDPPPPPAPQAEAIGNGPGSTIVVTEQPITAVVPNQVAEPPPLPRQRTYKGALLYLGGIAVVIAIAFALHAFSAAKKPQDGTIPGKSSPVVQGGTLNWPKIAAPDPEKEYRASDVPDMYEKLYHLPDDALNQFTNNPSIDQNSALAHAVKAYGLLRQYAANPQEYNTYKADAATEANKAVSGANGVNGDKLALSVALTALAWISELDNPGKQDVVIDAYTKATDVDQTVITYTAEASFFLSKVSTQDEVGDVTDLINKAVSCAATKREAAYALYKYYLLLGKYDTQDPKMADYEKDQAIKTDSSIKDLLDLGS